MDEGLAATISPTEQYSDLSDKELDCPFNVRCQMHGPRSRGRERVRFIQSWILAKICNVGSASVKSECEPALLAIQGCGGERLEDVT